MSQKVDTRQFTPVLVATSPPQIKEVELPWKIEHYLAISDTYRGMFCFKNQTLDISPDNKFINPHAELRQIATCLIPVFSEKHPEHVEITVEATLWNGWIKNDFSRTVPNAVLVTFGLKSSDFSFPHTSLACHLSVKTISENPADFFCVPTDTFTANFHCDRPKQLVGGCLLTEDISKHVASDGSLNLMVKVEYHFNASSVAKKDVLSWEEHKHSHDWAIHPNSAEPGKVHVKVSFQGDSQTFSASKAHLTARSPVLRDLLAAQGSNSDEFQIEIHDISPAGVEQFLSFLTTGNLKNKNLQNEFEWELIVPELLHAAERYAVPELKEFCDFYFFRALTEKNIFEMMKLAKKYALKKGSEESRKFLATHSKDIFLAA